MGLYGDRADALQREGYACSQCLAGSLAEVLGVDRTLALRFAGAFGSGIGCSGETCGAITGALMLIGLKYGKVLPDDPDDNLCLEVSQEYIKRFKEKFDGKTKCKDLLGSDPSTEEGMKYILDNELWDKKCPVFIREGTELILEILKERDSL